MAGQAHADGGGVAGFPPLRVQLLGGFQVWVGDQRVPEAAWRRRTKATTLFKWLALADLHRLVAEHAAEALWPELADTTGAGATQRNLLHRELNRIREILRAAAGDQPLPITLQLQAGVIALSPLPGAEAQLQIDVDGFEFAVAQARASRELEAYSLASARYTGELLPDDPAEAWIEERRARLRQLYGELLLAQARHRTAQHERGAAIALLERLVVHEPTHEEGHRRLMQLLAQVGSRGRALRLYQQLVLTLRQELDVDPDPLIQRLHAAIRDGRYPPPTPAPAAAGRVAEATAPKSTQPPAPAPGQPSRRTIYLPRRPPPAERAGTTGLRPPVPVPRTPLIGRGAELAQLRTLLLAPGTRLVTLTGPGGAGKTRLALEAATELAEEFPDGVAFVPLAALADPAHLLGAVATGLGLREGPGRTVLATLQDYLRPKRLLLVLDNLEHLLGAAGDLAALLDAAPGLTLLVTSRAILRVGGEHEAVVPPLAVPPSGLASPPEALLTYPAIALFVERAAAVRPGFVLDAANAETVVAICYQLDGLPLAIELAAAWVRLLSPVDLLARLEHRLALLTGGGRDLPARQQTLRNTIAWSYDLLAADHQQLLRRLAIFAGGWTVEAAEAICRAEAGSAFQVLDGLAALVEQSLVQSDEGTGESPRFRLLETVREYTWEQLQLSGEGAALAETHAAYYTALAEAAEPQLRGAEQVAWVDRLERERDNLRAALAWAGSQGGDPALGVRLVTALFWFWRLRGTGLETGPSTGTATGGYLAEGRGWLEAALGWSEQLGDPRARAAVRLGAGGLALWQGDIAAAVGHLEASLVGWQAVDDAMGLVRAQALLGLAQLYGGQREAAAAVFREAAAAATAAGEDWSAALAATGLGYAAIELGDYREAQARYDEASARWRNLGDRWGLVQARLGGGLATFFGGDDRGAEPAFVESVTICRTVGDRRGLAQTLTILGEIARGRGEVDRALEPYTEALALYRELGLRQDVAALLHNVGQVALHQGDLASAASRFVEGLKLARTLDEPALIAACLDGLAGVLLERDEPELALTGFAAARALRRSTGARQDPADRVVREQRVARLREHLGEAAIAAAWADAETRSGDVLLGQLDSRLAELLNQCAVD